MSTQVPPQTLSPGAQVQAPPEHDAPPGQTVPHAPQWLGSVDRSRHTPSHEVWPAGQTPQVPPQHRSPGAHATPQAPQWSTLEERLTHAPPHRT